MAKRLTIRMHGKPAVIIHRTAVATDRLVYIAIANKALKYRYGSSRIVYVGTTKAGASRIAASAAAKAKEMLALHGVKHLEFHVVQCPRRQNVKTWRILERALLLTFREIYGEVPRCNTQGKRMSWRDEPKYFTGGRLRSVVKKYS